MKRLLSLEEFNDNVTIGRTTMYNGIACPNCGEELVDVDDTILCSTPPQKNTACQSCNYIGYRYC